MCDLFGCGDTPSNKPLPPVTDDQRRNFIKGLAALPLATVLAYPELARASAHSATKPISIKTPSGGEATGVIAMPDVTPAPAVLLIHEWWGLNNQIKTVAAEFAKLGYIAIAVDMYGGNVATDREGAMKYMKSVDSTKGTEQLVTLVDWLRNHKQCTGKVGTIGWCFGGGWSLNTSLATPVDATVIYYGRVTKTAAQLASLQSPVLGHFGTQDKSINAAMVGGFEKAMAEAGKTDLTVHWYDANHAFANPTGSRYDEEDAATAWERTLAFYAQHLR
ncbi:dienelactone hydrolase family protein [Magnetospira sp. QH-2]|uniref:dienelactone hydrolase family protein n=1 Tax=Magnetospira sp. (strain QH-2) TaxID=1288970 RepID=UPI0003E80E01|nr:dienelactone hydrolase family protein [Magnetospira sp. QH-2]CCQ73707.1 Putative carboxymethylenebutenolidase [Magnetospira sp. QH-2]